MREVRRLTAEHIDAYADIAFNAYPNNKDLSEEGIARYKSDVREILENDPGVEFYGLFEGDTLIAVARYFLFHMNLFGRMQRAGGLGYLGVHLLYKRKKAASRMLEHFEEWCGEKGILVALLLPFRPDFYKRMGYGIGTKLSRYSVDVKQLPAGGRDADLRHLSPSEYPQLLEYHTLFTERTHGMILKIKDEIRDLYRDDYRKTLGCYNEEGELSGFMTYRFRGQKPGNYTMTNIFVEELYFDTPDVLRSFLGFLRSQEDQIQRVVFHTQLEDFHLLFANPLNETDNYIPFGFMETNTELAGTMYKILSFEQAFEEFGYRDFGTEHLNVQFEVTDERDDEVLESMMVGFLGGKALLASQSPDVTVRLRVSDFSILFLGCVGFQSLYDYGLAKVSDPTQVRALSNLFRVPRRPMNNTDF